ncbi:MAG: GNAT family N-acetyltransferase [Clostridia bacterium]|nr:GNAT family N-acetyltransferase [Clostridia bacterium]
MDELVLRPLALADVRQMENWRHHEDPWFYHYNFDCETEEERYLWLRSKRVFLTRDIFGLFLGARLIGFITIKNYNWLSRTAEMGISLDLNYVNQGYGSAGIQLYLDYVFQHTFFKRIVLRTAIFNERGRRAYEKVGFKVVKVKYMPYEEQRYRDEILEICPDVDVIDSEIYTEYYYMAIKKTNVRKKYEF